MHISTMDVRAERVAYVVLLLAVVGAIAFILLPRGEEQAKMIIDARTAALFHDAGTVVVRYVYPYQYPSAAVAAGEAAIMVFNVLGKRTIIQALDMNRGVCYTNEGNYERATSVDVNQCLRTNYPVLVILEAKEPYIAMHGNTMEVRGPPDHLRALVLYALGQIFPNVEELYATALSKVGEINVPPTR